MISNSGIVLSTNSLFSSSSLSSLSEKWWSNIYISNETTGNMNYYRASPIAIILSNGNVLISGGEGTGSFQNIAELYNPSTGTWTNTGSMSYTRRFHAASLLPNGKVLVAGGHSGSGYLNIAETYDPATGSWTVLICCLFKL